MNSFTAELPSKEILADFHRRPNEKEGLHYRLRTHFEWLCTHMEVPH